MTKLQEAVLFAAQAHAGMDREGDAPLPYITHPIEVLSNLRYVGQVTDEDMLCAAALHDIVEETPVRLSEIADRFGRNVESLVKELTREEPSSEDIAGLDKAEIWKLRSRMLLDEIAQMSPEAQAIKLADRLSNLREAKRAKRGEKLERYLEQTKSMLKIVHKDANPDLWHAVKDEL